MTLGQRISLYRKKLNISQEELGARLGVSRQAVSKWETDQSMPDMSNLLALAREFSISVAELTKTPEEAAPDADGVENPPTSPSNFPHRRKSRLLWIILGIFILLILIMLLLSASKPSEPVTPDPITPPINAAEAKTPSSDFALILDWAEDGSFLELGSQEGEYPFGTPLSLDGEETVVKGDNRETVYTIDNLNTGGIRLTYAHMDGQPDTILKLEAAYTKEISTPQGIHVGSTKSEVVGTYGSKLVYCVKEENDREIAELSDKNILITRLHSKGIIRSFEYSEQISAVNSKITALRKERTKLFEERDENGTLLGLKTLNNRLTDLKKPLTEFNSELFAETVKGITVPNNGEVRIEFAGGLTVSEKIPDRRRCREK